MIAFMSTVNKLSLMEEVERLKNEFDHLAKDKKINSETRMLFQSMLMLINLLVSIFLEKTTKKTSKNSSIPPSQTGKDESSTQPGTKGKGKLESDSTVDNTRTVETVTIAAVEYCDVCGEDLSKVASFDLERRTKIDIVFEKTVEHFDAEKKICPNCDSEVKGTFPSDMHGPLQYGGGIKAYIINLLVCQMISLNRVQKMVKTLIGVLISEATLLNFVLRLHNVLETSESKSVERLLKCPALNVDETSLRVDKDNQWIHVYSGDDITLKFLHQSRGSEAINAINIIPRYSGVIIHDCWSSYLMYDHCDHGLCGSHLLRELTYVIDSNGYSWALNIKALLQEVCKTVSKRKKKRLREEEYTNLQKRYRNILTRGEKELPAIPPKPKGQRGVMAKSDAHNLWERLRDYESAVLLFAKRSDISFTNNRAERDLRMAKVKQKISGCFRQELYAQAYCRISSYLQTMANKGYNPLIAIQMAFAGKFE